MFQKFKLAITSEEKLDQSTSKLLSLLFLLISGGMSFIEYTHDGFIWDSKFSFTPGLIASIISIFLTAPLYLRGIFKWNKSIYTIISLILILLVFASFIELALGGNGIDNIIIQALLLLSLCLSWLGIKPIAGVSWILAFAAAMYSLILNDITLGFFGFIYIVSGFLGLLLHTELNPGEFARITKNEFSGFAESANSKIKEDTNSTIEIAKTLATGV